MRKYKNYIIAFVMISCILLLYFLSNPTLTAYESNVNNATSIPIARWNIHIDQKDISEESLDIPLKNITWEADHTNPNKVAPGSRGFVLIDIDPTSTQVAIKYTLSYEDHTTNPDILLTITSISLDGEEIEQIDDHTYEGIITLNQIKARSRKMLEVDVEWVNDEANNEHDSVIGLGESEADYLNLVFTAEQYKGE